MRFRKSSAFKAWYYLQSPAPRSVLRMCVLEELLNKKAKVEGEGYLEVGPGRGEFAQYFFDAFGGERITLVENANEPRRFLRQKFDKYDEITILDSLSQLPTHASYNLILMCEVLEHVEDDHALLVEVREKLSDDGCLIISVPAYRARWSAQDVWAGHCRRYEYSELRELLEKAGFQSPFIKEYGYPLINLISGFRDVYYRFLNRREDLNRDEKTGRSGLERPEPIAFIRLLVRLFIYPFIVLQGYISSKGRGDGFVVLVKK